MWNNCTQHLHQMSQPPSPTKSHEGSSFSSPRVRFPLNRNTALDAIQFPHPTSPRFSYYANYVEGSPVYAFPYPMGNTWPLYQSPSGIGRRFGLVPGTPRSPLMRPSPRLDVAENRPWRVAEAAAVLSPAATRGLNVSSMSTTRGIKYGPVDEDLKLGRFKVRIVEIGEVIVASDDDKQ